MRNTGDHPKTAEAIARKINLILGDTKETLGEKTNRPIDYIADNEVSAIVVHGDEIDDLKAWQWDHSMYSSYRSVYLSHSTTVFKKQEIVFARTSPKHKLEIGELFPDVCQREL